MEISKWKMLSLYIMIKTCKIIDFDLSQDIKVANLHSIEELSNSFLYEDLYCVGKIMCLLLSTTQKKISICNGTSLLIPYGLDITKNCRATHCFTQRKPK